MIGINVDNKSSFVLITAHYLTAAFSFLVATILILLSVPDFLGHYFNPKLLSITHLVAIGWGVLITMGALYQLLPVIVNAKLFSTKLAIASYIFLLLGTILLPFAFWTFSVGNLIQLAGLTLLIGISLFIVNIFKTPSPKNRPIEYDFILAACLWLLITTIIGLLMAFNFEYVFLPLEHLHYLTLHAHIGILGFFVSLIIGVSSKLIPMFLLSQTKNNLFLTYSFYLINSSILLILIDGFIFMNIGRIIFYAALFISGIIVYLVYIRTIFKNRIRKVLDVPMKKSMYSFVLFFVAILFYCITYFTEEGKLKLRMINATALLFFMGFITMLILGQTFKTLPFIVWLHKYKDSKNRKVLPKDLYSDRLLTFQMLFFLIGFIVFLMGLVFSFTLLLYLGACMFVVTAILYCTNITKIIFHKTY